MNNIKIRLSKSTIGKEEKEAVSRVLEKEYLGMGQEVLEFEKLLTEFFECPAVCVANGTAALQLGLEGAGIGYGDEVLVQSLTYVASYQAISATGAKPISCDVDPENLTIDIKDAESRITNKTKAIMPMHYSGGVGNLSSVYDLAKKYKLRVIEDAAHAFGSKNANRKIGSFGDIVCFSFDGIKNITSGEGGCVVTKDKGVLERIRDARLLGVERDSEKRAENTRSWIFDVRRQGWRYHMSNIMATIGIEQLKKFPKNSSLRQSLAKKYDKEFAAYEKIQTIHHDYSQIVPHIYTIKINGMDAEMRDSIRSKLLAMGVETGVHYQPNHILSYYKQSEIKELTVTSELFPKLLTLPLHLDLTFDQIEYVCRCLKEVLKDLIAHKE
jgi:dTDP-4-amino-4,6-dideoxygalactose transaminase